MSLRQKIQSAIVIALFPLLALSGIMFWVLNSSEDAAERIRSEFVPRGMALMDLHAALRELQSAVRAQMVSRITGEAATSDTGAPELRHARNGFVAALDKAIGFRPGPATPAWPELETPARHFLAQVDTIMATAASATPDIFRAQLGVLASSADALDIFIDKVTGADGTAFTASAFGLENRIEILQVALVIALALIAAISAIASVMISRRIARPLLQLVAAADRLGQGEFDIAVAPSEDSETRRLTDAFDRMRSNLALLTRLKSGVFDAINEGVCVFDSSNCLVAWNRTFEEMAGYARGFLQPGLDFKTMARNATMLSAIEYRPGLDAFAFPDTRTPEGGASRRFTLADGRILEGTRSAMPGGGWVSAFRDMTDRHQAERHMADARAFAERMNIRLEHTLDDYRRLEQALRASEAKLLAAQRIAKLGSWEWTAADDRTEWSREALLIFGCEETIAERDFEHLRERVHPEDRAAMLAAIDSQDATRETTEASYRLILPDGTLREIHEHVESAFDDRHQPIRRTGVVQDVTERKTLQRALIESEMRLRGFMHNAPVGMVLKDLDDRYLMANPAIARPLGMNPEQLIGRRLGEVLPGAVADTIQQQDRAVLSSNAATVFENYFPELERESWTQVVTFPVRDIEDRTVALGTIVTDISERKRIEAALRETNNRLQGFMDHSPAILSVKDTSGRFLLINKSSERALNASSAEILGRRTVEINASPGAARVNAMERLVVETGQIVEEEVYWNNRDIFSWTYEVKFPIRNAGGAIVAIGGSAIDITERKLAELELRRSEARLARAQRIANVGHWVWSGLPYSGWSEGVVEYSETAAAIFGVPASALKVGDVEYLEIFVHPDDRIRVRAEFDDYKERRKRGIPLEYRILRPDGSCRTIIEISEVVAGDPEHPTEVIGTIRDITVRKSVEQELIDAKVRAEEANLAKSQFLANVSHELRTPLNAIIGFSEIITEQIFGPLQPERYRDCAKDIQLSSRHLLGLLEEVLDTSKIDVGQYELQEEACALHGIVAAAMTMMAPDAQKKRLHLSSSIEEGLPKVWADAQALRQALLNLLVNAVKFTPETGAISVSAHRGGTGVLCMKVTDTGIGIAPEHLEHIFKRFAQVDDSYVRSHGGIGLGLHITRSLIELHGGTVTVESRLGSGTSFEIHLPASRLLER